MGDNFWRVDIAACANDECSKKDTCKRWLAGEMAASKGSRSQSYCDFKEVDGECEDYWEVNK